jgi:hypothetical protein
MFKDFLQYETIEDNRHPGDFRVEAIDTKADGEVYTAIFTGPDAESRAREYADWKNSSQHAELAKAS